MKTNDFTRKAWLNYFNRTLREAGIISEAEYRKIKLNISQKYKGAPGQKSHNRAPDYFSSEKNNNLN